jgi:DNA-binding MarR family transcriptional regulator
MSLCFEVNMSCHESEILTKIVLTIFRLNGCLIQAGDELVKSLKLTSAKWQVMGAVTLAGKALTAPQIAVAMGITRQGAQKQVNAMVKEGLMILQPNSGHKRSPLIALSELGARVYEKVDRIWVDWANQLATGIPDHDLLETLHTLEKIRERLVNNTRG